MKIIEVGTGYTSIPANMGAATEIVVEELAKVFEKEKVNYEILDIKVQYTSFSILPNTYKKKKYESIPTTLLGEMKLYLDNDSVDNTIYIPRIRDRKSRTVRENILYQESIIEPKLF